MVVVVDVVTVVDVGAVDFFSSACDSLIIFFHNVAVLIFVACILVRFLRTNTINPRTLKLCMCLVLH